MSIADDLGAGAVEAAARAANGRRGKTLERLSEMEWLLGLGVCSEEAARRNGWGSVASAKTAAMRAERSDLLPLITERSVETWVPSA